MVFDGCMGFRRGELPGQSTRVRRDSAPRKGMTKGVAPYESSLSQDPNVGDFRARGIEPSRDGTGA